MALLSSLTSYDDITLVLLSGLILTVTAGIVSRSEPLAHPLVLGQQSEPSKVRRPSESAVYRNYGVGMYMPLPTRPKRDVQTINNFVQTDATHQHLLFGEKITNPELQAKITALGSGLANKLNLAPRDSSVLLLLEDSYALGACSVTPITLNHLKLLNPVLSVHPPSAIIVQSSFLHTLLEQLADEKEAGLNVVVVGDIDALAQSHARKTGISLIRWTDVLESSSEDLKLAPSDLPNFNQEQPAANDVFMISYYGDELGQPKAVQLTHQNMTAAVVSARGLLPVSSPMSASDRVLSSFSMNTPFGLAVAFQALYEGASFSTKPNIGLFKT
ncbi:hypothetical protein BDV93DRAFT_503518, partial [Ceratobasidium sp. AG-I]